MTAEASPKDPTGCRWIEGDTKTPDWVYCQKPPQARSEYCAEHHGRVWRRIEELPTV